MQLWTTYIGNTCCNARTYDVKPNSDRARKISRTGESGRPSRRGLWKENERFIRFIQIELPRESSVSHYSVAHLFDVLKWELYHSLSEWIQDWKTLQWVRVSPWSWSSDFGNRLRSTGAQPHKLRAPAHSDFHCSPPDEWRNGLTRWKFGSEIRLP